MTWREFQLKLAGYKRQQLREWERTRIIGYQIYLNTPIKGKHVSIEKYLSLGDVKPTLNNEQRALIKDRMRIAVQQAKEKANG